MDSGFTCGSGVSAGHLIQMRNILICQCGVGADAGRWDVTATHRRVNPVGDSFSTLPACIKLLISSAVIDPESLGVISLLSDL